MRPAFFCGALAAALALTLPWIARADDSVLEREAQARFEEGVARVKAGNIEGARASFAQAYAVFHKPTILWNLALAEEKTGHLLEALAHFKELARGAQNGGDDRGNAEKHIGALMAQTGHLDVSIPAGTQLFVDGEAAVTAPSADPLDVSAGRHHLQVQSIVGSREADVDVAPGQLLHVNLMPQAEAARPPPPPPAPQQGPVSTPEAPRENREERSGPSATQAVTVVTVATAAAVSLAFGAYFAIQSVSDENTAQGFRQQYPKSYCFQMTSNVCTQWNDAVQAQSRDATVADVFWVAGGVLAAGAAVTWLLWPNGSTGSGASHSTGAPRSQLTALRLAPSLGPAGAGLTATGRF